MKKRLLYILAMVFVLMTTGCGNASNTKTPDDTDSQIMDNIEQTDAEERGVTIEDTVDTEDESAWTMSKQIDGELFQNLNLDGIGDFDDEAYVSTY